MTPAAKPSDAARMRGFAMLTKKTKAAPNEVAAPAAATRPNAKPTFPDAGMFIFQVALYPPPPRKLSANQPA
jgi:hypothetical protein